MYTQPGYVQPGYVQSGYGTPTVQPMMQPMGQPMLQPVQPVYPYMTQPQQNSGPIIIKLDNGSRKDLSYCQFCQHETDQVPRKTIGCVAIAWGFFYFAFTGIFCLYPCFSDKYRDT